MSGINFKERREKKKEKNIANNKLSHYTVATSQ
jgi:hypothetical protein